MPITNAKTPVTNGKTLVVRGGQSTVAAFEQGAEYVDTQDKLHNLSVELSDGTAKLDNATFTALLAQTPYAHGSAAFAQRIIDKGGTIEKDPMPNNPQHGLVSNITAADLYEVMKDQVKSFAVSMTKQEVFKQLKAGINSEQASGYSISTLKELLSDLQPVNYKWLTYSTDGHSWSAEIKGNSWGTNLDTIEPGIAYPTIIEQLSQAIQAADEIYWLVNPYTPEAVEGLILRVSDAIAAAAKIPYLLQDLNRPGRAGEKAIETSVNMRVTNKSQSNKTILVFQKDVKPLTVKNYFVGAWQAQNVAPGANLDFVIPVEIAVRAVNSLPNATVSTELLPAQYGEKFVIDDSSGALTLTKSGDAPDPTTISISNKKGNQKPYGVGVYKNGRFVVGYSNVPPNTNASISIEPKVYLSFAFEYKKGDIFQAALVADSVYPYDLQGHPNIVVELTEDPSTHELDFGSAQYPDQIPQFGPDLS